MVLYLNNCRRQLWYFDSLPRTNGFSPSLACWVDLSWWKPNWAVPFTGFLSWKMMKCFPSWVQSPGCGHLVHFERECQGNIFTLSFLNNRLRSQVLEWNAGVTTWGVDPGRQLFCVDWPYKCVSSGGHLRLSHLKWITSLDHDHAFLCVETVNLTAVERKRIVFCWSLPFQISERGRLV